MLSSVNKFVLLIHNISVYREIWFPAASFVFIQPYYIITIVDLIQYKNELFLYSIFLLLMLGKFNLIPRSIYLFQIVQTGMFGSKNGYANDIEKNSLLYKSSLKEIYYQHHHLRLITSFITKIKNKSRYQRNENASHAILQYVDLLMINDCKLPCFMNTNLIELLESLYLTNVIQFE